MPFVVGKNYFELFGLPATYDLDVGDLTGRYRDLARQVHPDRFAAGLEQERRIAVQTTALLNEAFQTLKDPVARARYLLQLRGVELGEGTETAMDAVFLSEQMELRERLDDARHDAQPKARLAELAADVEKRLQDTTEQLRVRLGGSAATDVERARHIVRELQFLDKLRRQIDDFEE